MAERKTENINLRMAPATKELLRQAAAKERRTRSNMIEFLVIDHCERNGVPVAEPKPKAEGK